MKKINNHMKREKVAEENNWKLRSMVISRKTTAKKAY